MKFSATDELKILSLDEAREKKQKAERDRLIAKIMIEAAHLVPRINPRGEDPK